MNKESIEWLTYSKINQLSDAFIFSSQFTAFFETEFSTNFSTKALPREKYTAGSTLDTDDYELKDISTVLMPQKLFRINPFESNNIENIIVNISNDNYEQEEISFTEPYISDEAKKFLTLFMKKNKEISSKKVLSEIKFGEDDVKNEIFTISPRNYNPIVTENNKTNFDVISSSNVNNNQKPNTVNNITKENIISNNNKQEIYNNNSETRIEYNSGDISYDISNPSYSTNYDFTYHENTTTVINEMKQEIINEVKTDINKLEQNFFNTTVHKQELINVENKITNNIQNIVQEHEKSILEKVEKRQEKSLSDFTRKFLNS
jgi:hypothetical protein